MHDLWTPTVPYGALILRAVAVYIFVLVLLRLGGKRQIGQMGPLEFVALLLVSNAVQNAMNGGDNSLTAGFVLATVLIGLSAAVSYLTYRSRKAANIIIGRPVLLVYRGAPVEDNLRRNRISHQELHALLRRLGYEELKEIHEAILESNGVLSVVKKEEARP